MDHIKRRTAQTVLTFGLLLFVAADVQACKIPVFRFVLEQWFPDPYQAVILHKGKLDEGAESLATKLEAITTDGKSGVNLQVVRMDVEQVEKADDKLLADILGKDYREKVASPEIVLLYPRDSSSGPLAWRGPLTSDNITALVDSPARQKIKKMILDGESTVWVLIGNGDANKDKAAEQTLRTELAKLEKQLKMRDIKVIQEDSKFGEDTAIELRLGLKLIVLDLKDPQEQIFIKTLMRSEDDLEEFGEPVAIPVFGRGRSYLSLAGKGINPDMIEETCRFLIGDCGCEVKRQNPGVDLLFAVNWEDEIVGAADVDEPTPDLAGIGAYDEPADTQNAAGGSRPVAQATETTLDDPATREKLLALAKDGQTPSDGLLGSSGSASPSGKSFGKHLTLWIVGLIALGVAMAAIMTARVRSQANRQ